MGTEGMARLGSREAEESGAAFKGVPLQRYGTVKDIADGTVYLFSDAGSYVNGDVLVIDGGDWRVGKSSMGRPYPEFLLADSVTRNGLRKKAKL